MWVQIEGGNDWQESGNKNQLKQIYYDDPVSIHRLLRSKEMRAVCWVGNTTPAQQVKEVGNLFYI